MNNDKCDCLPSDSFCEEILHIKSKLGTVFDTIPRYDSYLHHLSRI